MSADEFPDDDDSWSDAEFLAWMRQDPDFHAKMRKSYEAALALPLTPETEELHKQARAGLDILRHHRGVMLCKESVKRIMEVVRAADFIPDPAELRRMIAQADEAMDHLLDVREPERSRMMATLVSVRDNLREILDGM